MKYFFKIFFIYLLLVGGYLFIVIEKNVSDLSGKEADSTVEFVYEEF